MHGFTTTRGQRVYGSDRGSGDQQHATFRRLRRALQRRVHPRHVRRLDPGRLPLRPVQRARVRHGEHRVHIRAGLLRVRVRRYVRQLARGPIRLQEVRHPLRHRLRDRLPPHRSSNLVILLASRVASGVAYSLLFSSFESWAITEADRLRLDRRYLVGLFSTATFFNACSAVAAGVVGNLVVDFVHPVTFGKGPGSGAGGTRTDVGGGWDDVANVATLAADYESGLSRRRRTNVDSREPARCCSRGNKYTPAFDVGAGVLFLCALGAYKLWWEERPTGVGGRNVSRGG